MKPATVTAALGTVPGVRSYVLVVEGKAAPASSGGNPFVKKKKRSDANPDLGPQPGGTIDGENDDQVADPADPNEIEPDHGAGADAKPFDQSQRPDDAEAEDTIFSTLQNDDSQPPAGADEAPQPTDDQQPAEPDSEPADPNLPSDTDAPQWAGDLDDTGDETDPANAFRSFTGSNGEQAWLDRAADGSLTGWVKTADGQVYRYTDADAWAIDVDDAHMTRDGGAPSEPADDTPPEDMEGKSLQPARRIIRRATLAATPR